MPMLSRTIAALLLSAAPAGINEDFSRGMKDWWTEGAERVWVEDGRLQMKADPAEGAPGSVATVWYRGAQPADFELELDAQVVSSVPNVNNINLFFNYSDPSGVPLEKTAGTRQSAAYGLYHKLNGYIITFLNDTDTGSGKARVRIRRNPGFKLLAETFTYHCRAGVTYQLKVTKQGGDIRFSVDGTELLLAHDPEPLGPGYFGLRTFRTWLWWDNIRLRALPLPTAFLPPLLLPAALSCALRRDSLETTLPLVDSKAAQARLPDHQSADTAPLIAPGVQS